MALCSCKNEARCGQDQKDDPSGDDSSGQSRSLPYRDFPCFNGNDAFDWHRFLWADDHSVYEINLRNPKLMDRTIRSHQPHTFTTLEEILVSNHMVQFFRGCRGGL
jgi:hypothetical protein